MGKVFSTISGEGEMAPELLKKIFNIRKAVINIEKNKHNDSGNYDYASEFDIKKAFQKAFDDEGVLFFMSGTGCDTIDTVTKNGPGKTTIGKFMWSITDLDGNAILGSMCGSGNGRDDKGLYAAITGAHKYALMTNFNCTTGDDAEANKFDKVDHEVTESRPEPVTPMQNPTVAKVAKHFKATKVEVLPAVEPVSPKEVQTPVRPVEEPTEERGESSNVFGKVGVKDTLITADDVRRIVGAFKKYSISEEELIEKSGYKMKEWSLSLKARALEVYNQLNSGKLDKKTFMDA